MNLKEPYNTIATFSANLLGAGSIAIATSTGVDLRDWTLNIQRSLNEQKIEMARLQAWRDGFQLGYDKGREAGR